MKQAPYPHPDICKHIAQRTAFFRLGTWYATFRAQRKQRKRSGEVDLRCVNRQTSIYPDDLPLVFVTRNNLNLLPHFLDHYRSLGVTRFICVDDQSADGSHEFLLSQKDIDVWTSKLRFKEARRGRLWREKLFGLYGHDRWYINVDSDEFLVFDGCNRSTIWALIGDLEDAGHLRMAAPMIDFYPADLEVATLAASASSKPWHVADHFDSRGYVSTVTKRGISILGGPRHRQFQCDLELIKYPLIYWDGRCSLGTSIHRPLPYDRNFGPIKGALLHFKFFSDYRQKISDTVIDGQHFDNAKAYRKMLNELESSGSFDFKSQFSAKYLGVTQLKELGFFCAINSPPR